MAAAETRAFPGRALRDWGLALLLALAFKQAYSRIGTEQLQWLLHPLAALLNATSLFHFMPTAGGEWLDDGHGLVIVKACAGGNFLIASWLGWLWRWREPGFGAVTMLRAFAAAWLTTLLANALRIVCIAYGQDELAQLTGISVADGHRLIGVGVYFGSLALQLAGTRTLFAAQAIYLGVAVLLPWLNAVLFGNGGISLSHVAWTASLPLATLTAYGAWLLVLRLFRRPAIRFAPPASKGVARPATPCKFRNARDRLPAAP